MSTTLKRLRRVFRRRRLVFLVPVMWILFAGAAMGGELRGTVRIVSAGAGPMQSSLDPYAGTLNSAGAAESSAPRTRTTTDVVVYLEGPAARVAPRPSAGRPALRQINQAFEPHVLGVPVGTTVSFPNDDLVYHNVFSYSKPRRFDLGYYGKGKSKNVTFDKPGVVQVFCDIHSTMSAFVLVVDTPFVTQPASDGTYSFPNLPHGSYTLKVWHPDLGDRSLKVTVGDTVTHADVTL